jgi:protein HIRA/HIR1
MTDHNGPVNVVRFSSSGKFLASGSDDGIGCIFELRSGAGGGVLGGESNIENWRTRHILRGHSSHIVDLGWSHDDTRIATASLDSTVGIWDAATGSRLATLRAHTSFVKGVAWDPVGTYLATMSEDRSVAVWRTDDWSLVATIKTPFERMVTATFACRLSWSPDGRFLIAGNSFQGATHAAVAVPRESWDKPEEYLLVSGHGGAVVATSFNPKLFRVPPLGGGPPSEELSAIFAIGGQDKRVTVWASAANRPIFCGSRIFKSQVLDLAWTPDGMALFASSSDGTVACLQFEKSELGEIATAEDMSEVMKALYGSSTGRAQKRAFAESAEQLDLEEKVNGLRPALAPVAGQQQQQQVQRPPPQQQTAGKPPLPPAAVPVAATATAGSGGGADPLAALAARLAGGPEATGAVTQTGFGAVQEPAAPGKRVVPDQMMPPPSSSIGAAGALTLVNTQGVKRPRLEIEARTAAVPAAAKSAVPTPAATALRLAALRPFSSHRVALGALPPLIPPKSNTTRDGGKDASAPVLHELQIVNKDAAGGRGTSGTGAYAEICLVQGDTAKWHDVIPGTVVAATGTPFFSAIATSDGHVQLHTPAGRRVAPPLRVGAGIALMTSSATRLLVVSTSGRIKLYDPLLLEEIMEAELAPLLEGGAGVLDVQLSQGSHSSGGGDDDDFKNNFSSACVPIVTLTDATAYIWHSKLRTWIRVADDSLATSRFTPMPRVPGQGELADVQADALSCTGRPAARLVGGSGAAAMLAQQRLARGVVECNLAAAEVLGSVEEYKAWLSTYARSLAEAGDEERLRELADSLLGPPPGSNDREDGSAQEQFGAWVPRVLGMAKRELLRKVVLRETARNRSLGGLLQRCSQALDEIEAAAAAARSK